jgi:N-acetyl-gamma-glutamyl-phosphate reductase
MRTFGSRLPVGVLGASGYAGRELCALIGRHPRLGLVWATAHEQHGAPVPGRDDAMRFVGTAEAPLADAALVFSALPHGTSAGWVSQAHAVGARVVDLSADLRPGNGSAHQGTTGITGSTPIAGIYGFPELDREAVRVAGVVANPGCYATAVLLSVLPVLATGLVAKGGTVSVCAASGVTGAGNSPRRELLFAEVTENYRAYATGNDHRHLNEMRAVFERFGTDADLVFVPHLLPVARGILATVTIPLAEPIADPRAFWKAHYAEEPFVEISTEPPSLRDVVYRNTARISVAAAAGVRRPALIVTVAIDNLLKGAAGQALQNANLLLGFEETMGLPA